MTTKKIALSAAISILAAAYQGTVSAADTITEAFTGGKAFGSFNLRFESVTQDNPLDDATALTLRTALGYNTDSIGGFSATFQFEDSRIVPLPGADDFSVNPTGFNSNERSIIADPETTEVDQFLVQYKNDIVTAKLGRQIYTLDDHRFIGSVPWRQDWQTFDALTFKINPVKEFTINIAYLDQRNRIFAEAADFDSEDFLLNLNYKTPIGAIKGYGYFLSLEDNDNDIFENDTLGVSFAPKFGPVSLYGEIAQQEAANSGAEAEYLKLEGAVKLGAPFTLKLGYELLGSDDGQYAFQTPLATLHKFNGFADLFLVTPQGGLEDTYFTFAAKINGGKGGKFVATYHDFGSDEGDATDAQELDLLYVVKLSKNYKAGVKYADFDSDGVQPDTEKFWAWVTASF